MYKYLISYFNLKMYALCCINFEAGEMFGMLILEKFGIILYLKTVKFQRWLCTVTVYL